MDSEGLLGTKVTWLEIEKTMQKSMETESRFGENKTITNIGDNKGFASRIGLIEADWSPPSDKLPHKFVVKIMHGEEMAKLTGKGDSEKDAEMKRKIVEKAVRILGNHEIEVYNIFKRENPEGFLYPKMYGYKESTKSEEDGFFILEFFENVTSVSMYENISVENVRQVMTAMASFMSLSEKVRRRKELYFWNTWKSLMKVNFFKAAMDDKAKARFPTEIRKLLGESHPDLVEKVLPLVDKVYWNGTIMMNLMVLPFFLLKVKPVLVHNDLWSANIIWTKEGSAEMKMRAIIDFAGTSVGNPAIDLSKIIVSGLSPADRRANTDKLLEEYCTTYLKALNGKAAPFSLEQLKELYKMLFPLSVFFLSTMMITFFEITPADVIAEHRSAAIEKLAAGLEDLLVVHEELAAKYPKIYNAGKGQLIAYTVPKLIWVLLRYVIF